MRWHRQDFREERGNLMQLFEWGIASKAGGQPGLCPVGVTGSALRAQALMLEALSGVPAGVLSRGWVTTLALGTDRLTYDRLGTLVRVTRDKNGSVQWLAGGEDTRKDAAKADGRLADLASAPAQIMVIDGRRLRELRRARGLSQEILAWRSEVDITTIGRLERQPRPPCRRRTLIQLAEVLGENPRALVTSLPPDRGPATVPPRHAEVTSMSLRHPVQSRGTT
jgi:DNA-binding XRE family transcriptional regulator